MLATGRVLWIGIVLLMSSCAFLWSWIRRRGRKVGDSFALLSAGLVLTVSMLVGIWMLDGLQLSRSALRLVWLAVFLPVAMVVAWLFNKITGKVPDHKHKP